MDARSHAFPAISLAPQILAVAQSLPRGGGYHWDSSGSTGGVLADVVHEGETIVRAGRGTYCSGITFDVWWRALGLAGVELGLTADELRALQRRWYIAAPGLRRGPLDALEPLGLGVDTSADPRPGDFAQLWRRDGSGHTVIVLEHAGDAIRYLSSQASTGGIGTRVERPVELYAVRPVVPTGWLS